LLVFLRTMRFPRNKYTMIQIREIDKKLWNSYAVSERFHTFLHSWNWGEFQKSLGHVVRRLGIFEDSHLLGIALIVTVRARRGTFLFCPHGPFLDIERRDAYEALLSFLRGAAQLDKASFIRLSPITKLSQQSLDFFRLLDFRRAPMHMHTDFSWILDVRNSEDALLHAMRKTTRYSIRKAQKEGVRIVQSCDRAELSAFYKVYALTVKRQHFVPFSEEYISKEFDAFQQDDHIRIFHAYYRDQVLSSAIVVFTANSGFYHHGASTLTFPKIPAAYLLQWEIIRTCRMRGYSWYNFWGIAPENIKHHPWEGTTLFKKGFGGFSEAYVPAQDYVLERKYWLNFAIESFRRWKRGFD